VSDENLYEDLRPRMGVLLGGTAAVAALSVATLNAPAALASTVLAGLMIAGADIDARTFLLPDIVTGATALFGVLGAALLDSHAPLSAAAVALLRALGTALALLLLRAAYGRLRHREGLGLGDVKLAAGIGAWLPLDVIPVCFALAAVSAIVLVLLARLRGTIMRATDRLAFGALLCPALWLTFYLDAYVKLRWD
jgi:leader peptidase (prepilin peptidase) / N-methyltransferase